VTYIAHDLLQKTVSRLDDHASNWPFDDAHEARIVAAWLETRIGDPSLLCYAISAHDGRVGSVRADRVRLGAYVEIPRYQITCPKCAYDLGPTYSQKPMSLTCPGCMGPIDWTPSKPAVA